MQPSHVKWEQVVDHPSELDALFADDDARTNGVLANGHTDSHTSKTKPLNLFKPVPEIVSRNLLVTDVYFESPPISNLGAPGPDGRVNDLGPNGLSTISQDVLDELPDDCRRALEEARQAETKWQTKWGTEKTDGSRRNLRIGFNGFPV